VSRPRHRRRSEHNTEAIMAEIVLAWAVVVVIVLVKIICETHACG
jgi:hypothetical protein